MFILDWHVHSTKPSNYIVHSSLSCSLLNYTWEDKLYLTYKSNITSCVDLTIWSIYVFIAMKMKQRLIVLGALSTATALYLLYKYNYEDNLKKDPKK